MRLICISGQSEISTSHLRHFHRLMELLVWRNCMRETTKTPSDQADDRVNLSVLNTVMATDRTLMAWLRTALSMITFGFTLYKVLEAIPADAQELPRGMTPRNAGLLLIAVGLIAVTLGIWQYWQTRRQLEKIQKFEPMQSPTWIMALITLIGGFSLFLIIIIRIL
jgi:putative membrane protein